MLLNGVGAPTPVAPAVPIAVLLECAVDPYVKTATFARPAAIIAAAWFA